MDIEKLYIDEIADLGITGYTQGSVLFAGASAVTEDNANFFWDDTNNSLGIGTTTPKAMLGIEGTLPLVWLFDTGNTAYWGFGAAGGAFQMFRSNADGDIVKKYISLWGTYMAINEVNEDIDFRYSGATTGDIIVFDAGTESLNLLTSHKLQFRDSAITINSATDGHLDLTADISIDLNSKMVSDDGRIVNTSRYTSNQTLDATNHVVMGDTDGGAFTVTLPAGVDGTNYKISNVGSSGNALTLAPDGSELLVGANANFDLLDGETLDLFYETTEGWIA